jgi:uridine monophosphate synthetase
VLRTLKFDRIAGIPYGSLPTATGLSLQLHKPLIYPRKEVKAHGTRRLVEGEFNEGETVAVVDDILITGGSVLDGIAKLESSGLNVNDVVVFLDHGGQQDTRAKERLNARGLRIQSVLSLETISDVLEEAERISADQAKALRGARR